MLKTIKTEKLPIKVWADDVDPKTLGQAKNLANLPSAFHHIAIMPDAHVGFGMPIGGVLATKGTIVPYAVGVDIGCGMQAIETDINVDNLKPKVKEILAALAQEIPLGYEHHKESQSWQTFAKAPKSPIIVQEIEAAKKQLGTLGGGNHFLEILVDDKETIWLMVHSGSRNFGYKTAGYYYKKAREINPNGGELAWLDLSSNLGQEYFLAMNFSTLFARENRTRLLEKFIEIVERIVGPFVEISRLDTHHNYAAEEEHFGQQVIVHRKGAVYAANGERVIIPGSMGSKSFIAEGLGNLESFLSCSHGAGRAIGRREATRRLNYQKVAEVLQKQGVEILAKNKGDLIAESPFAYKDIEKVMELQVDLAKPIVTLRPLGVVIG